MLNAILNGALGETSSRSGSSSSSRSGTASATNVETLYTLPDGKQYSLTKDQFDEFNNVYDKAYGIAYSMKSATPRVSDVLKYGSVVLDWYKQGTPFDADEYEREQGKLQQMEADRQLQIQHEREWAERQEAGWEWTLVDGKPTLVPPKASTPPEVKIPDNVVPSASVAPSEKKGNSLLVPGIILALGVIGAIALTSNSKKRR